MDAINGSKTPLQPAVPAEADPVAIPAQVLAFDNDRKGAVAATTETEAIGATEKKKRADAGMKNYFVSSRVGDVGFSTNAVVQRVFGYGTKLDYFLITLCCLTSIGSGLTFPLMNVVFGESNALQHLIVLTIVQASWLVTSQTTSSQAQPSPRPSSRPRSTS
jgi:ATP-binding cassette subfamily B (MDR/TAP) protein 1